MAGKLKPLTFHNGQFRASVGHVKLPGGTRRPKVFMLGKDERIARLKEQNLRSVYTGILARVKAHGLGRTGSADVFNMPAGQTSVQLVPVGDPCNPADTTGYGAVGYTYNMGRFDVTAAQYTKFLNAVAWTDPYSLYNSSMGSSDPGHCGITRSGGSGNYTCSVISNKANFPINDLTWGSTARFGSVTSDQRRHFFSTCRR